MCVYWSVVVNPVFLICTVLSKTQFIGIMFVLYYCSLVFSVFFRLVSAYLFHNGMIRLKHKMKARTVILQYL